MFRVFYHYYYLFYSNVLVQPDPHFETVLALSAMQALWINAILDTFSVVVFCHKIGKWPMIGVLAVILFVNFKQHKESNEKHTSNEINFFSNHTITVFIVIVFSIIGISWLFWGSFFSRSVLQNC